MDFPREVLNGVPATRSSETDRAGETAEVAEGKENEEGANELVDEYFKRLEYLKSRQLVMDERTAAPLTDEEVPSLRA